jgi:agmatinase
MVTSANFGAVPRRHCDPEKSGIVIIPVPYDRTSTWVKGAGKGPAAIIEASANLELCDIETDCEVYKKGIFTEEPPEGLTSPEDMINAVTKVVGNYLGRDKFVVVVGGEHSVSIGSVKAHLLKYEEMTVLQLDAHADLRDEYNGSKYNHACVMARVRELCPVVQVGIRSMDISEKPFIDRDRVFFAKDIYNSGDWIKKVVGCLSENAYVTIDLDVFDPSIMPSTGTPEPGGLLWYDVLALLRAVTAAKTVVGFDVVELCPIAANKAPDFLAAKLIYKLLSYKLGVPNAKEGFSERPG